MDDRAKYWIGLADYDIETANAMLKAGRYLYVGFMCHQKFTTCSNWPKVPGYFL